MKRACFFLVALFIGTIVAFLLAELATRIIAPQMVGPPIFAYDERLGIIQVPHQCGRRTLPGCYTYTFCNNALGLRGSVEYREGKSSKVRILALGDSFTYGIGVDDDQTFAHGIEQNLIAHGFPAEVINAGVGGTDTGYALKFFNTIGKGLRPDITVLCFYSYDISDNLEERFYRVNAQGEVSEVDHPLADGVIAKKDWLRKNRLYTLLIERSHFANLIKQAICANVTGWSIGRIPDKQTYVQQKDGLAQGYAITESLIRLLKEKVDATGSDFMILFIPTGEEVRRYRKKREVSRCDAFLQRVAASLKVPYVSLEPLMADSGIDFKKLYFKEGHWSALTHRMAADYMTRFIEARMSAVSRGGSAKRDE